MKVQRYLSNPYFACRRWVLFGALSACVGVVSCSGDEKDSDIEGITEGGDGDASGIEGDKRNKKKGKGKDKSGKSSNMPDEIPNGKKKKGNGNSEDGPNEAPKDLPCEIDFLFVIDHSGSMESEQTNLQNSVPEFIKTVTEEIEELEDYHIGVVTTGSVGGFPGMGSFGSPGCKKLGALVTRTSGLNSSNRSCGPYANKQKFMTKDDDLDDKFVCAAKLGTSGTGDEKPMEAMVAAVGKELNTASCNAGFLRKEALLVVTIITDEEDDQGDVSGSSGSKDGPEEWYKALVAAKGGDPKNVVVLGLIGTEKDNECDPLVGPEVNIDTEGAQISERLMTFVKKFKKRGVIGDVCAENYGEFFREAVGVIDLACEEKPPV